jgi:hypothetical protein
MGAAVVCSNAVNSTPIKNEPVTEEGGHMNQKTVQFLITKDEKKILKEVCFLEPYLQDNLRKAKKEGKMIRICFDAYDLFDAISAVQYAKDSSLEGCQQADDLLVKMKKYLHLACEPGQRLGM